MDQNELKETLNNLSAKALTLLNETLKICLPLYKKGDTQPLETIQFVNSNLFTVCYSTSESVLLLISNYRLWDAHSLYRTILEATIKMMFISSGTEEDRLKKCEEFWYTLPDMKLISRHKKAVDFFSISEKSIDKNAHKPMKDLLLSEEELATLESKYPKRIRKQMEQKWSFSEMVRCLTSNEEKRFETLMSTYHDYSIGSHLIHVDGDAIGVIWDRSRRETERRISKELAHGTRMISAILTYASIRAEIYFKIYNLEQEPLIILENQILSFIYEIERYYSNWLSIEYEI